MTTHGGHSTHLVHHGHDSWVLNGGVTAATWTAIIPAKPLDSAKSRLANGSGFAEAFLLDVIAAVQSTPSIIRARVVTSDDAVRNMALRAGCSVTMEEVPAGINQAVALASAEVPQGTGIVVLLGDLPCLTGDALTMALAHAALLESAFISDEAGTGSTMWFSRTGAPVRTHFGERSRAAHRAAGAVEIDVEPGSAISSRLHRDVDTEVDLWDALRIGVGEHTTRLVSEGRDQR